MEKELYVVPLRIRYREVRACVYAADDVLSRGRGARPIHRLSITTTTKTDNNTLYQLMELLRQHPFRAYPVTTHDQEFLGLVKRTTLLRHLGA